MTRNLRVLLCITVALRLSCLKLSIAAFPHYHSADTDFSISFEEFYDANCLDDHPTSSVLRGEGASEDTSGVQRPHQNTQNLMPVDLNPNKHPKINEYDPYYQSLQIKATAGPNQNNLRKINQDDLYQQFLQMKAKLIGKETDETFYKGMTSKKNEKMELLAKNEYTAQCLTYAANVRSGKNVEQYQTLFDQRIQQTLEETRKGQAFRRRKAKLEGFPIVLIKPSKKKSAPLIVRIYYKDQNAAFLLRTKFANLIDLLESFHKIALKGGLDEYMGIQGGCHEKLLNWFQDLIFGGTGTQYRLPLLGSVPIEKIPERLKKFEFDRELENEDLFEKPQLYLSNLIIQTDKKEIQEGAFSLLGYWYLNVAPKAENYLDRHDFWQGMAKALAAYNY